MSFTFKIWRATIGRFLGWVDTAVEQKRLRQSFNHPILFSRREFLVYYENGRSTVINSDFALGKSDIDLVIYRKTPLKWQDTGELLSPEESDKVYSKLPHLLASKNIRWAYSEMIHRTTK
jgi:hypothetical protein